MGIKCLTFHFSDRKWFRHKLFSQGRAKNRSPWRWPCVDPFWWLAEYANFLCMYSVVGKQWLLNFTYNRRDSFGYALFYVVFVVARQGRFWYEFFSTPELSRFPRSRSQCSFVPFPEQLSAQHCEKLVLSPPTKNLCRNWRAKRNDTKRNINTPKTTSMSKCTWVQM